MLIKNVELYIHKQSKNNLKATSQANFMVTISVLHQKAIQKRPKGYQITMLCST
ncbi:hypothetical protein VCE_000286 [Vibrio cholerae B33]|nr:hypothetical protein VCE_000286 [Vibrio cholerae B33]